MKEKPTKTNALITMVRQSMLVQMADHCSALSFYDALISYVLKLIMRSYFHPILLQL